MNPKVTLHSVVALVFLFLSCNVPHRSYVGSSFEPVTVKEKGDLELSLCISPYNYYKFNGTYALTNRMALRLGYSGFAQLDNVEASLIFFKNFKKSGLFVAPCFNYEHNYMGRRFSNATFAFGQNSLYQCEYTSPGLAIGLNFLTKKGNSHHLIVKTAYNIINQYSYYYQSNTASGRSSSYYVKDEETLNYKIPDFFSIEPSYSFVVSRPTRKMAIRYQLGITICQAVFTHHYTFYDDNATYGNPQIQEATNVHPVYVPLNLSIGFIFKKSFKKDPSIE